MCRANFYVATRTRLALYSGNVIILYACVIINNIRTILSIYSYTHVLSSYGTMRVCGCEHVRARVQWSQQDGGRNCMEHLSVAPKL